MKNLNIISAKDALISLASKLPDNLLLDAVNEEGQFTMAFLLRLNDVLLNKLKEEAEKQDKKNFFLFFYSVPEEKVGKEVPCEVKNFSTFDFSKVKSISFNGSTAPLLPKRDYPPIYYVSVTLVLKS